MTQACHEAPAAVRSLVPHRLALTAVMVTAVLSATLLAALVSFAATVTSYAVRATLRPSPATGILVTAPANSAAAAARGLRAGDAPRCTMPCPAARSPSPAR